MYHSLFHKEWLYFSKILDLKKIKATKISAKTEGCICIDFYSKFSSNNKDIAVAFIIWLSFSRILSSHILFLKINVQ